MNVDYILSLMPAVGRGTMVTLQLFFCTLIFALPLGLPFALGSISKIPPLRWISKIVIIPQTIKRILPPVANESITLVKDTALVYTIGLTELLMVAKDSMNRDVDVSGYIIVALIYLALTALLTFASRKIEKRFSRHERESV